MDRVPKFFPRLHLFDEKYNKNKNIVKYYCNLICFEKNIELIKSIFIYFHFNLMLKTM